MEPEVPLSTFTAFISSTGAGQLAKVEELREKYDPQFDFYLRLRDAAKRAIFSHDASHVYRAAEHTTDKKQDAYTKCARGIDTWLSKTEYDFVQYLDPIKFNCGELPINVTTDFLLRIRGELSFVKVYLRQDAPTRDARNAFSYLVTQTHGKLFEAEPMLLVAREAKLLKGYPTKGAPKIVKAEAAKFLSMWRSNKVA